MLLIAQRQDQLERGACLTRRLAASVGAGSPASCWVTVTGRRRALLFLLGVLAVSVILATVLGAHGSAGPAAASWGLRWLAAPCTALQRVAVRPRPRRAACSGLSAQCGTTLLGTGFSFHSAALARWRSPRGRSPRSFIAGFTNVVRKTLTPGYPRLRGPRAALVTMSAP